MVCLITKTYKTVFEKHVYSYNLLLWDPSISLRYVQLFCFVSLSLLIITETE